MNYSIVCLQLFVMYHNAEPSVYQENSNTFGSLMIVTLQVNHCHEITMTNQYNRTACDIVTSYIKIITLLQERTALTFTAKVTK